jgi:hypothetical protein
MKHQAMAHWWCYNITDAGLPALHGAVDRGAIVRRDQIVRSVRSREAGQHPRQRADVPDVVGVFEPSRGRVCH